MKKNVNAAFNEVLAVYQSEKSASMVKYFQESLSNAYKLECGLIVVFNKPNIEKRFCFSHDSDRQSIENAHKMANKTSKTYGYFASENMKQFNDNDNALSADLKEHIAERNTYSSAFGKYLCQLVAPWRMKSSFFDESNAIVLTENDVTGLRDMVKIEKEKFSKRLELWWKRYGAGHIKSWSYDAWD